MKYGYVRVSTKEQHTDRQLENMKDIPKENFFVDKISGKDMERPQLKLLLNKVKKGDKIVVDDITRLVYIPTGKLHLHALLEPVSRKV